MAKKGVKVWGFDCSFDDVYALICCDGSADRVALKTL